MRREYKTGSKWAIWRWKDVFYKEHLYLRRLIIFQCPLFSIMLHWFHDHDRQAHLHNHPVDFISIVLRGWYIEETYSDWSAIPGVRSLTFYKRKFLNFIPHTKYHRITAFSHSKKPITLCFAGPHKQTWGFMVDGAFMDWKTYHSIYESSTS